MGVAIDVEQPRSVNGSVNLCRRQAGVSKQFLKGPKVRSPCKEMRRKAVPQGVRRKRVRQPQSLARCRDRPPDQIRIERPAASADKKRRVALDWPRALPH